MKIPMFALVFVFILAACSLGTPQSASIPTAPVDTTSNDSAKQLEAANQLNQEAASVPAASKPAWQTLPLVNARSGETFTLGDFEGQTVFVEPMATWCTNCRQQLGNVRTARESLSNNNVAFVALSVETNVTAETLAQYAEDNNFGWTFAVATPELLAELVNTFGRTITNPPSTPHFIIRPDGTATSLVTGIESSEQIISQITTEGNL